MKLALIVLGLGSFVSAATLAAARQSELVRAENLVADVRVVDGVATTRIQLSLASRSSRPEEATWLLPLPEGSVADDFRMTVNGVTTEGEVLAADRARDVYESIVRARRDPGLLEFVGRGCLRARVFPVPPGGRVDVSVTYREVLPRTGDLLRWSFPVTSGVEGTTPEHVVLSLQVESRRAMRNVFSNTPGVHVSIKDAHSARASFESRGTEVVARELTLFYGVAEGDLALDLLSSRAPDAVEGTFVMLLSAGAELHARDAAPRSIVFALDTSGSMHGKKILQARAALRYFLGSLTPRDEFNVVPYSTEAQPFFPASLQASPENVERAVARAGTLEAAGGTNIDDALRASLANVSNDGGHVPIVVLLTDGLPTVQETSVDGILAHARQWNRISARIFVFGVGDDVNTQLLDTLADDSGGTRGYVRPAEDIELVTSDLFAKLSHPVLTNLELAVEGVEISRVVPRKLPDLFHSGRLTIVGRYTGSGPSTIRLRGNVAGEAREFTYSTTFAARIQPAFDFVESLWAQRRVAALLDQIRLHGADPELVDEVRRLGVENHIVTPYTSHLILEEGLSVPRGVGGGPATPGTGGPASPGPSGPTTPGPATPGAPGGVPSGPRGPATTGGGRVLAPDSDAILDAIVARLQEAGVLPPEAPREELRKLAIQVAREMRAADELLRGLGRSTSGSKAIDESVYLERLVNGRTTGSSEGLYLGPDGTSHLDPLVARFTRRVKGKVFSLRRGVWTDRALVDESSPRITIEAYSDGWFALLERLPALTPYFAFSERVIVVLDGVTYEVRPPSAPSKPGQVK